MGVTGAFLGRDLVGIVLAGGRSQRMGRDKAALCADGTSFLFRACALLEQVTPAVVISIREDAPSFPAVAAGGRRWCPDAADARGPIGGIIAGLELAGRQEKAGILALACDLPLMTGEFLSCLLQERQRRSPGTLVTAPYAPVVPPVERPEGRVQTGAAPVPEGGVPGGEGQRRHGGHGGVQWLRRPEPLAAVWECAALPFLRQAVAAKRFSLLGAVPQPAWHVFACPRDREQALLNANTLADLERAAAVDRGLDDAVRDVRGTFL